MNSDLSLQYILLGLCAFGISVAFLTLLYRMLFPTETQEYRKGLARLETRIVSLETALRQEQEGRRADQMLYMGQLRAEQNAHLECERKVSKLEGRLNQLSTDIDLSIRRHDMRNERYNAMNLKRIRVLESMLKDNGIEIPPEEHAIMDEEAHNALEREDNSVIRFPGDESPPAGEPQ